MFQNLPKFNQESHIHFITAKTFENYPFFKNEKCCLILLEELDFYRKKLGFKILGYVIMPDHFHCLIFWDVEKYKELTISKIMQRIKGHSARQIIDYLKNYNQSFMSEKQSFPGSREPLLSAARSEQMLRTTHGTEQTSHKRNLRYQIWQSGFYDFNIYIYKKFKEKLDYIHNNPARANLVKNIEDYKWSSHDFLENNKGALKIDKIEI